MSYLFCRYGYCVRDPDVENPSRTEVEQIYSKPAGKLLVLVPSYKEDPDVLRQTLFSAALMEYPRLEIVLLLDDPPKTTTREDAEKLQAARRLPGQIEGMLRKLNAPPKRSIISVPRSTAGGAN